MALTREQWLGIAPPSIFPPIVYIWRLEQSCTSVIMVSRRLGGAVIAVPAEAVDPELCEAALEINFSRIIGPSYTVDVAAEDGRGVSCRKQVTSSQVSPSLKPKSSGLLAPSKDSIVRSESEFLELSSMETAHSMSWLRCYISHTLCQPGMLCE